VSEPRRVQPREQDGHGEALGRAAQPKLSEEAAQVLQLESKCVRLTGKRNRTGGSERRCLRLGGRGEVTVSPRAAVAVLSLAAVPVAGEVDAEHASPVLRLVWVDPTDVAAGSELAARAEAEALLSGMGVAVSWRRGSAGELMQKNEVWVILVGEGPGAASDTLVLGSTRKSGSVAPAVWVRVPNVRRAVGVPRGPSLFGLFPIERRLVAVALGRVIAHEVVHAVAPSVPHGTGLTSANLTRRQLRAPTIPVEPEVAFAVQAALRGSPVFAPAASSVMAAHAEAQPKDR